MGIIKIGLSVQGGGTRGIYAAGALDVLLEHNVEFPFVAGTSAGSLSLANYLSKDKGRTRFVIAELMSDPRFVSVRNAIFKGTAFDFDYLFYEIPKKESPFNFEQFASNPAEFAICATDLNTGKRVDFLKSKTPDPFKALQASSSLPLLSRPVYVQGTPCLDGGPACSLPYMVPLQYGMDKVVVIATREKGYRKKPVKRLSMSICRSMYKSFPEFIECYSKMPDTYNRQMEELDKLEREGKAFVVYPSVPPTVKVADKDKEKLNDLYYLGKKDMESALGRLMEFMDE